MIMSIEDPISTQGKGYAIEDGHSVIADSALQRAFAYGDHAKEHPRIV